MKNKYKKIMFGGILAICVAVPSSLYISQVALTDYISNQRKLDQEQFKVQLQEQEERTNIMLKEVENLNIKIDGLQKLNKELESKNSELEWVRLSIISNVGYLPSTYERQLLERLVECEAGGETITGKIAVVNVVLNRIKSEKFPNSILGVIYQENQFEPVISGAIDNITSSEDSKEAVKRAFLGERIVDSDILYFWASWLDKSNSLWNHVSIVQTIGVHNFGRGWD